MPMLVEVSRNCGALLIAHSNRPISSSSMGALPSGNLLVPMSDDTYASLAEKAAPGETVGQVVERLVTLAHRKGVN